MHETAIKVIHRRSASLLLGLPLARRLRFARVIRRVTAQATLEKHEGGRTKRAPEDAAVDSLLLPQVDPRPG